LELVKLGISNLVHKSIVMRTNAGITDYQDGMCSGSLDLLKF